MNRVGLCYANGKGVAKNNETALKWFIKSADAGFPLAHYYAGNCYDLGIGTEVDWNKAAQWYEKGAGMGDVDCKINLGEMYVFGVGGKEKNITKARSLFGEVSAVSKKAKMYIEVLDQLGTKKSYSATNSNFDKLTVASTCTAPWVMSSMSKAWGEEATFNFGNSTSMRVWPSSSAVLGENEAPPFDEISYSAYSSSELFKDDGTKNLTVSNTKPTRTIGYMYVYGVFNLGTVVVKVPMALCWKP
ncbi:MAG: hypothetical protein Fur0041_05020 [Bacteroidia bacterium]